jgi:hypothetical protein
MTTIYVDSSAALLPGAPSRLVHLTDAGLAVVLIAAPEDPATAVIDWPGRLGEMPDDPPRGSWFVTADVGTCHDRQAGLSTLLIGPRDDSPRPTRCDMTVRDLGSAVLEILAREAMN